MPTDEHVIISDKLSSRVVVKLKTEISSFSFCIYALINVCFQLNDISSEDFIPDNTDTSLPVCWRAKSILRYTMVGPDWLLTVVSLIFAKRVTSEIIFMYSAT